MNRLFVTGCYRSGTTLLEKLLHQHPQATVASQPFPVLFFLSKARFLEAIGVTRRYPLHHLFLEADYTLEDFYEFLDRDVLTDAAVEQLFEQLAAFRQGLWTPEILDSRERIASGTFFEVFEQLLDAVAELFPKRDLLYVGSKEILCEEYIPYLERRGVRVLSIVRDPRDLIASLNFNLRDNATGGDRPVLYSLRLWRKSVAIALENQGLPGYRWLRYEDLASRAQVVFGEIAEWLGMAKSDHIPGAAILDQRGLPWASNSSFRDGAGVFTGSIGSHVERVPARVCAFTEALCGPEMTALGYLDRPGSLDVAGVRSYSDPFEAIHDKFPPDYSCDSTRLDQELERLDRLAQSDLSEAEARLWFLGCRAHRRLRESQAMGSRAHDLGTQSRI